MGGREGEEGGREGEEGGWVGEKERGRVGGREAEEGERERDAGREKLMDGEKEKQKKEHREER